MSSRPSPGFQRLRGLGPVRFGSTSRRIAMSALVRISLGIALCIAFGGCENESVGGMTRDDGEAGNACSDRPVRMGVAASLRDAGEAVGEDLAASNPPIEVETSFGASSALARQVELGAPIDVLVSADEALIDALATRNAVAPQSIRPIAEGRLVLATHSGSAYESLGLESLRSPRLKRIGLPSEAVPLGRYGHAWLEAIGILDELDGKLVATENARANLTALVQGHVDLAVLYETDFRLEPELVLVFRPDTKDYPAIRYVAARTSAASECRDVDRVLEAWRSPRTRARLADAGFQLPAAPAPIAARTGAQGDASAIESDHR